MPVRATAQRRATREVLTVDQETAGGRTQQPGRHPGDGRLAGAVGPEEGDRPAFGHRQGDAEQGPEGAVGGVDLVDLQQRRGHVDPR